MKKIIISLFVFFVLVSNAHCAQITDGIKLLNSNKLNSACEFFKSYTENNPNDPDGHYWLGYCYKKAGQMSLAHIICKNLSNFRKRLKILILQNLQALKIKAIILI